MPYYSGEPIRHGPVELRSPDMPGFQEARAAADVDLSDWYERAGQEDDVLYFAVAVSEKQAPIGEVILHDIEPGEGQGCVHAHLFKEAHRICGHGEHALKAVVEYAFKQAKLKSLRLLVNEQNFPARRCYAKCGFQQIDRDDADRSQVIMCLAREEWRQLVADGEW
jgi:RimJ/RimL family protein N-acetyltransferase